MQYRYGLDTIARLDGLVEGVMMARNWTVVYASLVRFGERGDGKGCLDTRMLRWQAGWRCVLLGLWET